MFNGSASLRNAAGQMIENVNKSVRRKQTVDAEYMEKLQAEMVSLYRLDQIAASDGKQSFGPLPVASKALLLCLALCWMCMGAYVVGQKVRKKP